MEPGLAVSQLLQEGQKSPLGLWQEGCSAGVDVDHDFLCPLGMAR